jgi:DNA-binding transcriptional ArsR family regulator
MSLPSDRPTAPPASEDEVAGELAKVLRCLANDRRLAVLDTMLDRAASATRRPRRLDLRQATVSRHVRALQDAGLIRLTEERPARIEDLYEITDLGRRVRIAVQVVAQAVEDEQMAGEFARALRCLANAERLAVLDAMLHGAQSSGQAHRRLDLTLANISYQVRKLDEAGLIRLTALRPRRGPTERLYEVTELGRRVRIAVESIAQAVEHERNG